MRFTSSGSNGSQPLIGLGDDKPFEKRLAETIAWCTPRARADDPQGSLRGIELRPRVLPDARVTNVCGVVRSRGWRGLQDLAPVGSAADLKGGRLLVYFPDAELSDGAAEAESGGFFDVYNAPPWDTWVALFRDEGADVSYADYVVCWVPPALVEAAAQGIYVNPEECILWLEDTQTTIARELRKRGILG